VLGVFVLDSLGRIVFSNPAGQKRIGDGIDIVNQRLLIGPSSECAVAEAAIGRVISGDPVDLVAELEPILIHRQRASRPLVLYVLPIAAAASAAQQFLTHARAIVLLIDPEVGGARPIRRWSAIS
jgi:hypothetical protein